MGGTARLPEASHGERRAVANLLGLASLPERELAVSLARLDRALRDSRFAVGLPEVLELLGGPLRDRPAERAAEARRREALWQEATQHPLLRGESGTAAALNDWLDELRSTGLLRRLAGEVPERELLDRALRVLEALPRLEEPEGRAEPPVRRGVLAATTLGSSHALDPGSPVATLVLRALARLAGHAQPGPSSAAERRELWERAGVVLDELSSQVLVLGLRPAAQGGEPPARTSVAEALRGLAVAGEPARLTLRQLGRLAATDTPFALPPDRVVRVCENPVVVAAAADRLGAECPPLVCPEGVPSLAARDLLTALARQGGRIRYHGDFDWAGVRIAGQVMELLAEGGVPEAFAPWRFGAADYRRALAGGADGPPLDAPGAPTPWDPELARAMADAGRGIEEETVLDELLADLGAGPG